MSLSASMWTSVSGLLTHGDKMNVVGNNIANVSTIGFKGQRMDFNDYLYMDGGSASGPTQIGAGVGINAVLGDYSQGSFESTNSATDLALDGNGFFGVRKPGSDRKYYTRAGDFYFNQNRELQNPQGLLVQGWEVENKKKITFNGGTTAVGGKSESAYVGSGSPTDIVLNSWHIPAQQTTNVTFNMQLSTDQGTDRTISTGSPLTALFDQWNAGNEPPLPNEGYATQSAIKVYDEGGTKHELTTYYDRVETSGIKGLPEGYTVYEYLVTIPPSEDMRSYGGEGYNDATKTWTKEPTKFYDDPVAGTNKQAGVLMSGVMIFNASGEMVNQTAYTFGATGTQDPNDQYAGNPDDKNSWQPTRMSSNGLPVFTPNFTGQPLANSVSETMTTPGGTTPFSQAQNYIVELDFGLRNTSNSWLNNVTNTMSLDANGNPVTAGDVSLGVDPDGYGYYALADNSYGTDAGGAKVFRDQYGFYTKDGADNVYGTYNDGGPKKILHDGTGYYYMDAGVQHTINITDPNVTRTQPVNRLTPEILSQKNSLASLHTNLVQNGVNPDGSPRYVSQMNYNDSVPVMATAQRSENASVAAAGTGVTRSPSQDGYASGNLSGYSIDENGIIYGKYDNGANLALWQISIYDVQNYQGLYREGGNLFSTTRESGEPSVGVAGSHGFGKTKSYYIEMSNVDMAREFVQMITTQRGFQANSKGVTTVDTMLETVIGMKR
ncbi:flagellar hook-basal body complex protein [Desulfovibrio sp. ZJ200]|uniref:flagellar hook-basal body complex protein n=1 Tax=Desulfovibrio sp. ZJ200 TaxID=2709792 RepID=UPI0013EB2F74|nr:flagellar hook-basal body complex protein [Desulfovibrio sp. ZJ200]